MAPKDHRPGGEAASSGASGGRATAAGKRTVTQGIVQKKDAPVPADLSMRPRVLNLDGGLPENLRPAEPTEISDDIAAFRAALDASDRQRAMQTWHTVAPAQRIRWSQGATIERELEQIKRVLGTYLLTIMADTGLTFGDRPDLLRAILRDKSAQNDWLASIARHPVLWQDFLGTLPPRDTMNEEEARSVGKVVMTYDDMEVAKKLFAHLYAPLRDDAYDPTLVRTRPWKMEWIHRLYTQISENLPLQHARTVKDFAIGFEEKERTATEWKPLRNAWWHDRHVILNESSTSARDGGGTDHNMTGGGKKGGNAINHFDVGVLHEVGHGVGQELDGNAWTMSHPFVGWQTGTSEDDWSKGLWGSDGDLKQRVWEQLGDQADVLDASEARKYMAHRIAGKPYQVTTPGFRKVQDVDAFIRKHYADQKLTKYWDRVMRGEDRKGLYKFAGDANIGEDDRVYVFLTRASESLCSYNAEAHRQRVSSYSMSSPYEWFAEQYAHYHRLNRSGDGLDAVTKQKLDELHTAKYLDPDAIMKPDFDAAPSGGAGNHHDRPPFPW